MPINRRSGQHCNLGIVRSFPLKLFLQTDGGPDQNITFLQTKLALLASFEVLNIDILIATRCTPGQLYLNVAERVMSPLNIGLQKVAIKIGEMPEWLHEILDKYPSMLKLIHILCSLLVKLIHCWTSIHKVMVIQNQLIRTIIHPAGHLVPLSALTNSDLRHVL